MPLTSVSSVEPLANSHTAPVSTNISATFDQNINANTANPQNLVVQSPMRHGGAAVSTVGATVTFDPESDFFPGELVQVTATGRIQSTTAEPVVPKVWEFRTAVNSGSGRFVESEQALGTSDNCCALTLGDVDGDGDLDALDSTELWLNDGRGAFRASGQSLEIGAETNFGDVDGDGDLDVIATGRSSNMLLNNGNGVFIDTGQSLTPTGSAAVATGDVDGDGDLDVMLSIPYTGKVLWLNNGSGLFTNSGQILAATYTTRAIEFGDFDIDGDLDAFMANEIAPNRVWLNNGSGVFEESGQFLGSISGSTDLDLGDVDGDGDLDAFVTNRNNRFIPEVSGNRVWLNNGDGVFTDSGQVISETTTNRAVDLGDIDGDGDLDAFVANSSSEGNRVWFNDGAGLFSDSGQRLGNDYGVDVSLGDLDGDSDLDAFLVNFNQANRVWMNQDPPNQISLSVDKATVAEAGGVATITATSSTPASNPITVDLAMSGTAAATTDYTVPASEIVIAVGATTGSITIVAVDDVLDEPDETVIVDITAVVAGTEMGTQQATITILDDDEPPVPDVSLTIDNPAIPEAAGVATFSVTLSEPTTIPVTVDLSMTGTAMPTTDYVPSSTQITVTPGNTTGSITVTAVQDTLDEPDESVIVDVTAVTGGNEVGTQQQTTTIIDDDNPAGFMVSSLVPTSTGFVAELSADLDASMLNLYGSGLGDPDAVLTGATSGPIAGSLVVDRSLRRISFVKTGDPLAADSYTVRLRSAADGFKDLAGTLLDGNRDGRAGDDFVDSFMVAPPAAGAVTLALPDFVRGPGQDVNLPADATTGIPLSIKITEGPSVRAVDLRISYDPALLDITGATVGAEMPAGASVVLNTNTPGLAILVFFSTAPLPAGTNVLVNLQASVPTTNASEHYGRGQVLDIHNVTISDGLDNEFPVVDDDAMQLASYFADVSGNGRINASDASQVARFAALLVTGFAGSLLTDPIIVGDISGNGRINAADASLVARFAALIDVSEIPPVPGGIVIAAGGGPKGMGNPFLLSPQQNLADADERDALRSFSSDSAAALYYPAIDSAMADLARPASRASDNGESNWVFEDVLQELLSVFDQKVLGE